MLRSFALEQLPEMFSRTGPAQILYWQWLALLAVVPLAYSAARLLSTGLAKVLLRVSKMTHAKWDEVFIQRFSAPARLFLTGLLAQMLIGIIDLSERPDHVCTEAARMIMLVASFWGMLRGLDIAHAVAREAQWVKARPATGPVVGLSVRVFKVIVMALGVVTTLQQLGYPVAGLIAGLGIGGLAIALAAQKTLENLLGSVMLSIDQPFRVGDLVKLDDTIGVVELIGLRSTRIRTVARTIVTVPNGKLADMRCEDISLRDRHHLPLSFLLGYGTSSDQVQGVLEDVRALLRSCENVLVEDTKVSLREFATQGISIEVLAWFELGKGASLHEVRERVHLGVMQILERRQVRFALDPRTRPSEPSLSFDALPADLPRATS